MTSDCIKTTPKVTLGRPVTRKTRIPVELVVRRLGDILSQEELLDTYPRLTPADIQATLFYPADALAHRSMLLHAAALTTQLFRILQARPYPARLQYLSLPKTRKDPD